MTKPALERIARALCSHDGHPENIRFEGQPMWRSYLPPARAALAAISLPDEAMVAAAMNVGSDAIAEINGAMIEAGLRDRSVIIA